MLPASTKKAKEERGLHLRENRSTLNRSLDLTVISGDGRGAETHDPSGKKGLKGDRS
jgi:hypothetical protein